jgi:superfamily I DNA/RNA helicase
MNIDKVVSRFLKDKGYSDRIIYGQDLVSLWQQSIDEIDKANNLPIDFYQDEWERVIIEQGILTLDQYKLASRIGRGYPINRKVKERVWEVMVAFKKALIQSRKLDINLALARAIDIAGNFETAPYTHIIIDEMQDFTTSMLSFIRKFVGVEHENDIFLVGDERQSIYGRKLVLKNAGINVVGRSSILRINYRTTEEIRRWADKILDNKLLTTVEGDKFLHEPALSLIHGKKPTINIYQTKEDENIHIIEQIEEWIKQGYDQNAICITAKLNKRLDQIKLILNNYGIKTVLLKNSAEEKHLEGIRLGTMHRIKGKEFNCVLIAGLEDGILPNKAIENVTDEVKAKELEQIERSLLYVAVTRAKLEISISCTGKLSRYIQI